MGIYDPVLQAYQHGVDQRIQLASQPMTLAQSILQGYQQGFGNRMQQEHLGLQRDQLAEQQRRAQAQEAEARQWHQGQEQNRLAQILQSTEITDNDQLGAWRKRIEGAGLPGEMLPKQLQQDPGNVAAQGNYDANQQAAEESPYDMAGPGGSSFQAERPADKLKPWRGSALGQKYAETERKASHNQVMEGLTRRKLDQADVDQLRKQGLTDAQVEAINFKIERGEELLPYEKSVLGERAALYSRLPQDTVSFGSGSRANMRGLSGFDSSVDRALKQENDRRQKANENIINGRDLTTGKPATPMPMMTREEAEELVKAGWERLSETTTKQDSGVGQEGGGPVLKPKPQAKTASGAAIKLKIKASKPVAKDGSGKEVWKVDGKFYYGDGTEYRPPAK